MIYLTILAALSVICAVAWAIAKPGYDSGFAVLCALSALASALIANRKRHVRQTQQQIVSRSSIGIQTGGDAKVGKISGGKSAE